MTPEEAKRRLSRCAGLNLELHNRLRRLGQLQQSDRAEPLLQGSRAEEYTRQIAPIVQANRRELAEAAEAVQALPDPLEREVLRLRYLETLETGKPSCRAATWPEVGAAIFGSRERRHLEAILRVHRRALQHLAAAWAAEE